MGSRLAAEHVSVLANLKGNQKSLNSPSGMAASERLSYSAISRNVSALRERLVPAALTGKQLLPSDVCPETICKVFVSQIPITRMH